MQVLFALAALLALAVSQCSIEGNTYTAEEGTSITFGKAVGDWVPAIITLVDGTLYFSTWTQATASRWQVKDFSSTANWFCNEEGQYNIELFSACTELHFVVLHDNCAARMSLLESVFPVDTTTGDCTEPGSKITTNLAKSEDYPRLAGDKAVVTFGLRGYAIVSVDERAALFQRWRITSGAEDTVEIVDLASYPEGYACDTTQIGIYTSNFDEDCATRLCFFEDACRSRAELFHDIGLNDFAGDKCTSIDDKIEEPTCGGSKTWLRHPYDCLAQDVPGGCMFCKGIAMGETNMFCLERQGAGCNEVFNSLARQTFCNLEFECPAASITASFAIFIFSLLALLLR